MIQRTINFVIAFRVIIVCIAFSFSSSAQEPEKSNYFDNASIVARIHYGFLLAHHERVEHLVRHTYGFEISLSRQTDGKKMWQQYYQYPQTGISYLFLDFNYPEVLGNAHAIMAFINLPLVRKETFQFSFRMASGLGYVTKKYERVENYKNDVIGSNVNVAVQLNFETRYQLSQHLLANFNLGITHFSNGSFRTPNLGINNPSVNAGLTYQFHDPPKLIASERHPFDRSLQVDLLYAAGVKEMYPTGKQYFAHTLSSAVMKPLGYKVRMGLGLDLFYDLGLFQEFRDLHKPADNAAQVLRSGIYIDNELVLEKLAILFQVGVYWLDNYNLDGSIYNRVGFKYLVSNHFFLNLTLKTHYAKADYAELGVGWKFRKEKKN